MYKQKKTGEKNKQENNAWFVKGILFYSQMFKRSFFIVPPLQIPT